MDERPKCPVCGAAQRATRVVANTTQDGPDPIWRDGMLSCPNDGDDAHQAFYEAGDNAT